MTLDPTGAAAPARDARDFAVETIRDVVTRRLPLDDRLERLSGEPDFRALSASDRGLARAIATVALRWLGVIRHALAARMRQGLPANAGALEPVLIAAAAQILVLDVPDYAAVDTAITRLRRDRRAERYAGLANAVLRAIARDKVSILASVDALDHNTPAWLAGRWRSAYGEQTARAIATAHLGEPALDITAKSDAAGWAGRLGGTLLPGGAIRLIAPGSVTELPGFGTGDWWVQDCAAALPVRLLAPRDGERILDLCAAPGGKTAQIAATGAQVTAVDRSAARMARLETNLARLGLTAQCHVADAGSFSAPLFDRILLDAPCSATGTIRRHPDVAWNKTLADIATLAEVQHRLLDHAWSLLRPGGTLVYATCSLEQEEGESQASAFRERWADARLMPVKAEESGGIAEWVSPAGFLRTLPCHLADLGGCDGFFAARFMKSA